MGAAAAASRPCWRPSPLVLIGFAASLFGFWELRMPYGLTQMAARSHAGYFGSLFMGLTMGVVAAPCIGPFVLGLLTWVAGSGSAWLGFAVFFTLSLGLGLPLFFLALFSGRSSSCPDPGSGCCGCASSWAGSCSAWRPITFGPCCPTPSTRFCWPRWPSPPASTWGGRPGSSPVRRRFARVRSVAGAADSGRDRWVIGGLGAAGPGGRLAAVLGQLLASAAGAAGR